MMASSHIPNSIKQVDLKSESTRLKTFQNWPLADIIMPKKLAQAGFFYFNDSDIVKCPYCSKMISNWRAGDDPDTEHLKRFPSCSFVKDVIVSRLLTRKTSQEPEAIVDMVISNHQELDNLGLTSHPHHKKYVTVKSRIESFLNWPEGLQLTPVGLAEAGFYYNKCGDEMVCFSCGVSVNNWEPSHDPWIEHAKYGKCEYVLLVQGAEFIEDVVENMMANKFKERESAQANHTECVQYELDCLANKIHLLELENQNLKELEMCKVCMEEGIEILFLPCKHLFVCLKCVEKLNKTCPVCRKAIVNFIKVHFA